MAKIKNVMEKINNPNLVINPRYDITFENAIEIIQNSEGVLEVFANSYKIGYLQGQKAARAKMR